jgi:hypothetical protein
MTVAGFPHSGITGSQPACGSPMLFAAYHALPRLSVPRHPPCALVRLTGNARSRRPSINRVAPRCTPRASLRRTAVRLGRRSSCALIYTISLGLRSRFRQKTTTTHREVISASDSHSSTTHTQNPKSVSIPRRNEGTPRCSPRPLLHTTLDPSCQTTTQPKNEREKIRDDVRPVRRFRRP